MARTSIGITAALTIALAGAAALPAAAERGGHRGAGHSFDFSQVDADGNGAATRDELIAQATARIGEIDTDGDGMLSREEIVAAMPDRPGSALRNPFGSDRAERRADRMLTFFGATEEGAVAISEIAERRTDALLARADADSDGALSEDEIETARERFASRDRRGHHGSDGSRGDRDRF